jgi:RimJ/RimL family protein N-acetyltransferase
MMCKLLEVAYSDLSDLIQEAESLKAFLPSKSNEFSFLDSMGKFEGSSGSHFFLFVQGDAETVGFATILPYKADEILSIGPIYVKKKYQGQGLGKTLVEEIISWAMNRGLKGLFTQTWGENERSRRVFEKLGFKFLGEKPDARVNGDSTIQYMLKWAE